jgi:predicted small secreted protein
VSAPQKGGIWPGVILATIITVLLGAAMLLAGCDTVGKVGELQVVEGEACSNVMDAYLDATGTNPLDHGYCVFNTRTGKITLKFVEE